MITGEKSWEVERQEETTSAGKHIMVKKMFCLNQAPVATGMNTADFIQMMSTGNAVDFGDSTQGRRQSSAASNGHGGL